MSRSELTTFIEPERDTHNSNPPEIEFISNSYGRVVIKIDDRELTFMLTDLKELVRASAILIDDWE